MNPVIHRYIKELRTYLPIYGKKEKLFISDMRQTIQNHLEETRTQTITYAQLVDLFGEPKDISSNYIVQCDADSLRKAIQYSRAVKVTLFTILLSTVICIGFRAFLMYKTYTEFQNSYINREVIEIQIEPESK